MRSWTLVKLWVILLTLALAAVSGCTVRYVADYDASIENEIVSIAKEVDMFWGALLDTDPGDRAYDRFKTQYNQIETAIRGLVMKNEIRALNRESTKQAQIALELWMEDRALHKKSNGFTDFEARRHRIQFLRIFTAMAKGEEAKRATATGKSGGSRGGGR